MIVKAQLLMVMATLCDSSQPRTQPAHYRNAQIWSFNLYLILKILQIFNLMTLLIPKLYNQAGTYLQLPLRQWGAGNVYLLRRGHVAYFSCHSLSLSLSHSAFAMFIL